MIDSVKPRTRQQRRVHATRQRLLQAGRKVFAAKGLDTARIDEITEAADLGKGTFYYHFKTKEQLIAALIESILGNLISSIETACAGAPDLAGVLDRMIAAHIEFFSSRREDFVLYYQGRADLTLKEGYEGIETPFLDYLTAIERVLEQVMEQELPPESQRRVACAVAGFVSGYFAFTHIATDEETAASVLSSMRRAMVSSLSKFITSATRSAARA